MRPRRLPRPVSLGLLLVLLVTVPAHAEWSVEVYGGAAHHFSSPLTVSQDGFPDLKLDATYEGRPLEHPIYFGVRVGLWRGHKNRWMEQ